MICFIFNIRNLVKVPIDKAILKLTALYIFFYTMKVSILNAVITLKLLKNNHINGCFIQL